MFSTYQVHAVYLSMCPSSKSWIESHLRTNQMIMQCTNIVGHSVICECHSEHLCCSRCPQPHMSSTTMTVMLSPDVGTAALTKASAAAFACASGAAALLCMLGCLEEARDLCISTMHYLASLSIPLLGKKMRADASQHVAARCKRGHHVPRKVPWARFHGTIVGFF